MPQRAALSPSLNGRRSNKLLQEYNIDGRTKRSKFQSSSGVHQVAPQDKEIHVSHQDLERTSHVVFSLIDRKLNFTELPKVRWHGK
jgi:hypothetical protein